MIVTILIAIPTLLFLIIFSRLIILSIRALSKYTESKDVRKEKLKVTLGERLKQERVRHKMTQEFVAETIGVSRQAVSKWENGISDPSTSNLFAISNLYEIDVDDLIKDIQIN